MRTSARRASSRRCAGKARGSWWRRSMARAVARCARRLLNSCSQNKNQRRAVQPSPLAGAKTIVVKVGSSLVTREGSGLDVEAIARLAEQIAELRALGRRCVLVSSGAIAAGMQRLGWTRRPHAMHELQAAAAVGQ